MQLELAALRILNPLSELLRRPLKLVDASSPEAASPAAVRLTAPRIAVVSEDGASFSEFERRIVGEMFHVIKMAEECEARFSELEQRMMLLQRENLELSVRNRELAEVSSRDVLTGLYNRWYVLEKIESEINRALRHNTPVSLLMLDLDHFKRVNDTYGHPAGDQVLQVVGKLLRDSCRIYDVPARYGGEEFCIVLPETHIGNSTTVAERIRERLAVTFVDCGGSRIGVTASMGIAGFGSVDETDLSAASLIERADQALYTAKSRGRNRVELWPSCETSH
ncbi:MAG: GGDEF domain-containing protein [Thermoanaerobaculia bacterium]